MTVLPHLRARVGDLEVEVPSLDLHPGRRLVLFGQNGAGKTTMLRLVADHLGPGGTAYLPQRPWAFRGRARRNLHLGLDPEARERADDLAGRLGVDHLLDRPARSLSGGERQRIALARTLAHPGAVVLLDEPLQAIDARDRPGVAVAVAAAIGERAAITVTHDRDEAAMLGDELAVVIAGSMRQHGPLRTVLAMPDDEEVAAVVGVGNAMAGTVRVAADGLAAVTTASGVEVWGVGEVAAGTTATALFGGETVTVHAGHTAGGDSARNHWTGTVERVRPLGRLVEIVVDCGAPVAALLTPGSAEALGITQGSAVTLAIKATAVRVVPR